MPNTPAYILYHGRNTGKDKDSKKIWTRIGAVWPNKSGKGFNLTWDYLPLGDGLTVMLPYEGFPQFWSKKQRSVASICIY